MLIKLIELERLLMTLTSSNLCLVNQAQIPKLFHGTKKIGKILYAYLSLPRSSTLFPLTVYWLELITLPNQNAKESRKCRGTMKYLFSTSFPVIQWPTTSTGALSCCVPGTILSTGKYKNTEDTQTGWFCGDCVRQNTEAMAQWIKVFVVKPKGMLEGGFWHPQFFLWFSHVCSKEYVHEHTPKWNKLNRVLQNWEHLAIFQVSSCPSSLSPSHLSSPSKCDIVRTSTFCEWVRLGPFSHFCASALGCETCLSCLFPQLMSIAHGAQNSCRFSWEEIRASTSSPSQLDLFCLGPSPNTGLLENLLITLGDWVERTGPSW